MQDPIKRFTFSLDVTAQATLHDLAKTHKLTQGEVIETLLSMIGYSEQAVVDAFTARRESKVNSRTSPWAIFQREKREKEARKAEQR